MTKGTEGRAETFLRKTEIKNKEQRKAELKE